MRNWHETERRKAAERRAKGAAAPSTVGIFKWPGEGERRGRVTGGKGDGGEGGKGGGRRGGVLPKRLKSGSGNHRLDMCGPSNGRHKVA